jgi:type II secretory pathway pseudopilin PulG
VSLRALAYLQLPSIQSFIDELKRRRLSEARLVELLQAFDTFRRVKLRLTSLDAYNNIILRHDLTVYYGLEEPESEDVKKLREDAKKRITEKFEKENIAVLDGEYS